MQRIISARRKPIIRPLKSGAGLSETKFIEGDWLWPKGDDRCASFVWKRLPDLHKALEHCDRFKIAVQAGGNCGVWPDALSRRFTVVYTFEADPLNFRCLAHNAPQENVYKFNAAIGDKRGCVDLYRTENCGAHQVTGTGIIPMLRIDDLALPACDFMQLDIEGFEYQALMGAQETIKKYHPLIMYEKKGKAKKYDDNGTQIPAMLDALGYKLVLSVNSDWIYKWSSQ